MLIIIVNGSVSGCIPLPGDLYDTEQGSPVRVLSRQANTQTVANIRAEPAEILAMLALLVLACCSLCFQGAGSLPRADLLGWQERTNNQPTRGPRLTLPGCY